MLLFSRFKQDLQNTKTWIVIGYNFNDEFIRSIFFEALERKEETHELIIVTPCAPRILKEKFNKYEAMIKVVSKKFGDKQTTTEIIN